MGTRVMFALGHPDGASAHLHPDALRECLDRWYRSCGEWIHDFEEPPIGELLQRVGSLGLAGIASEEEARRLDRGAAWAYCGGYPSYDGTYDGDGPDSPAQDGLVRALALARRVLREGLAVLEPATADEAGTVDCLVDHFFAELVEHPSALTWASDSWVNVRHYVAAAGLIARRCAEASRLWSFILEGRGIGRPDGRWPYRSKDGVFHLSSFRASEVQVLRLLLDGAFPELTQARWREVRPQSGAPDTDHPEDALIIARGALDTAFRQSAGMITLVA